MLRCDDISNLDARYDPAGLGIDGLSGFSVPKCRALTFRLRLELEVLATIR